MKHRVTNYHVVNDNGEYPGKKPERVQVLFEAVDSDKRYEIQEIVWSSNYNEGLDASLLKLKPNVTGVNPLPVADDLPELSLDTRVYVIGHPIGEELQISLQDNLLLDHEGPPVESPRTNLSSVCIITHRQKVAAQAALSLTMISGR